MGHEEFLLISLCIAVTVDTQDHSYVGPRNWWVNVENYIDEEILLKQKKKKKKEKKKEINDRP